MRIFVYEAVSAGACGPTPATSLAREGWAMLRSLLEDASRIHAVESVLTVTRVDLAARARATGERIVVATPAESDDMAGFDAAVRDCDATLVVAPESDGLLLELHDRVAVAGGRWLGCSRDAIVLTGDKLQCAAVLRRADVPVADTAPYSRAAIADQLAAHEAVSVKPRDGAGGGSTYRVSRAADLQALEGLLQAGASLETTVVSPWIAGRAASVAFLSGEGRCQPFPAATQEIEFEEIARGVEAVRYRGGRLPLDPESDAQRAVRAAQRAVEAFPGLRGFVGVDLVIDAREVWTIEVNPRMTTSYLALRELQWPRNLLERWVGVCGWNLGSHESGASGAPRRERARFRSVHVSVEAPPAPHPRLAIDIGGANTKLAHEDGTCRSLPFRVWEARDGLREFLFDTLQEMPPWRTLRVTTTAELCDCYASKREGVEAILAACQSAARAIEPQGTLQVWTLERAWRDIDSARAEPLRVAAANWLALAEGVAMLPGTSTSGLLVDFGSTTLDVVPLQSGRAAPRGLTDTERLLCGELVYTGRRRTPVFALCSTLPYRGRSCPTIPELFATVEDAAVIAGRLREEPHRRDTADGRELTIERSIERLARVIGADGDTFTREDAVVAATEVLRSQSTTVEDAVRRVAASLHSPPRCVVLAGEGEGVAAFAARRALPQARLVSFAELHGEAASRVACAWSLLGLEV